MQINANIKDSILHKSTENVKKIHNFVGKLIPSNTLNMSQIPV